MDFKDIASVAGKPGLYKIVAPTRTGVILESLGDDKKKLVAGPSHRVSVLSDISIYTTTTEGAEPLQGVMMKIFEEFGDDPGVDSNSSKEELYAFLEFVIPELDKTRVYPSDIKKLISWYRIIYNQMPELLKDSEEQPNKKAEKKTKEKPAKDSDKPDEKK
ncbi:MAG: DUF5606 family protein [Candidatus Cyclobacteriaceae bacterium M2_1C_046]